MPAPLGIHQVLVLKKYIAGLIAAALCASSASAHQASAPLFYLLDWGFWDGLSHPVLGFDHFLAMISVGVLSAQIGGRAIWSVPLVFVVTMVAGSLLGMANYSLPSFEFGVAFSVFALGALIAADQHMRISLVAIFVAIFAVFHGYAHGVEMSRVTRPGLYAIGFVAGTGGIHLMGVMIGIFAKRQPQRRKILYCSGLLTALAGLAIIATI